MNVQEIMNQTVESIDPNSSLRDAAQIMARKDYGSLPVVQDGRVIGMITDRDICIRAVADGDDPDKTEVQAVMSEDVFTCSPQDEVSEVARKMQDRQVRRLPVTDDDKNLVGFVSLGDLAVLTEDKGRISKTVEEVSQPLQH